MKITVLGSGSKGNSCLLQINETNILIDVGFSYRTIKEKLSEININPKDINYIFITHDHSDHIKGLSVFLNNYKPVVFLSEKIAKSFFNFPYKNIKYYKEDFIINDINVTIIPTSHDATDGCGYVFKYNNESLVYITDTGYIPTKLLTKLKNKTYYIIESNHDINMLINGSYPPYLKKRILGDSGHLSNELCGMYLSKIIGPNTKKIVLAHLSEENNSPSIALKTVNEKIVEISKCELFYAPQDEIIEVI